MSLAVKTEHPILSKGHLVRAILAGRKTQTRRVVRVQPEENGTVHGEPAYRWPTKQSEAGYVHTNRDALIRFMLDECPYGKRGHTLWVREGWRAYVDADDWPAVNYHADDSVRDFFDIEYAEHLDRICDWKWRPSIHMPRWACRLFLRVTDVRVERLWEITEADAIAEGMEAIDNPDYDENDPGDDQPQSYRAAFRESWDVINAKRGYGWDENPWVWVVSFEKLPGDPKENATGAHL